jgi:hypothetical protein
MAFGAGHPAQGESLFSIPNSTFDVGRSMFDVLFRDAATVARLKIL